MKILRWILNKISFHDIKCDHTNRFTHKQYFDGNGTPMIYFSCWDCGFIDEGHVHGDPYQMKKDGWEKEIYGKL